MLRYGTTGQSMVPNGVIGDLYVQFPFQQKKDVQTLENLRKIKEP